MKVATPVPMVHVPGLGNVATSMARAMSRTKRGRTDQSSIQIKIKEARKKEKKAAWKKRIADKIKKNKEIS